MNIDNNGTNETPINKPILMDSCCEFIITYTVHKINITLLILQLLLQLFLIHQNLPSFLDLVANTDIFTYVVDSCACDHDSMDRDLIIPTIL